MEQSVTINNDVCRCCATQGTFKNIRSQYQWMGEEEIYADMIRECFNITLCLSESCLEEGICEVCITQLRNASNFKRQVLQTEEQFKRKIEGVITEVKLEDESQPDGKFIDSDTELHEAFGDDFLEDDYPLSTIKEESKPKLETKAKKRSAKTVKTKTKKTKTEEGETSTKRSTKGNIVISIDRERRESLKIDWKDNSKTKASNVMQAKDGKLKRLGKSKKVIQIELKNKDKQIQVKKKDRLAKHQENLFEIMKHSNATPIKCKGAQGYACCFCVQQYQDPADLKQHNIETHNDKPVFIKKNLNFNNYKINLDITCLQCNCGQITNNLSDLTEHITKAHDANIHTDIKSCIMPIIFDYEDSNALKGFKCAICVQTFGNFKVLVEHLNVHFRNFICEVCGSGFVNAQTLAAHRVRHEKGIYKCDKCPKKFDCKPKKQAHQRAVHVYFNRRSKCGYCGERFAYYAQKNQHEVKVHGVTPIVLRCLDCDQTFPDKRALTRHVNRFHLMKEIAKKPRNRLNKIAIG